MSNSLDPDQGRRFVGPDLGPNCLQRLLVDYCKFIMPGSIVFMFKCTYVNTCENCSYISVAYLLIFVQNYLL